MKTEQLNLLKAYIALNGMKSKDVAKALGLSGGAFSAKLSGKQNFSIIQAKQLIKTLGISSDDVMKIFFA